jgi:hypothetical protein
MPDARVVAVRREATGDAGRSVPSQQSTTTVPERVLAERNRRSCCCVC